MQKAQALKTIGKSFKEGDFYTLTYRPSFTNDTDVYCVYGRDMTVSYYKGKEELEKDFRIIDTSSDEWKKRFKKA